MNNSNWMAVVEEEKFMSVILCTHRALSRGHRIEWLKLPFLAADELLEVIVIVQCTVLQTVQTDVRQTWAWPIHNHFWAGKIASHCRQSIYKFINSYFICLRIRWWVTRFAYASPSLISLASNSTIGSLRFIHLHISCTKAGFDRRRLRDSFRITICQPFLYACASQYGRKHLCELIHKTQYTDTHTHACVKSCDIHISHSVQLTVFRCFCCCVQSKTMTKSNRIISAKKSSRKGEKKPHTRRNKNWCHESWFI